MTELHNTTNNSYNSTFDWLDHRNNNNNNSHHQQQYSLTTTAQLPPINNMMNSENSGTTATANNLGYAPMEDDRRASMMQHSSYQTTNTSNASSWITPNQSVTQTSNSYSPRDSCDLSYESEDYQHNNHGQPTPSPSASTERSRSKKHRTPSTRDIHVEKNTEGKPPYSYATLIKYAIENSQRKKLTLSEIYQWVIDHYPYYGSAGTGWKNSIRHNLSLNKSFVRVARPINEPGKGSYWQVDHRAAEAEIRSKTSMTVRGRANRSGSDPSGNNPYRPDSSISGGGWPGNNNNNTLATVGSGSQRFTRDSRSLSLDSNMSQRTGNNNHFGSPMGYPSTATAATTAANVNVNAASYYGNYSHYNNTPRHQQNHTGPGHGNNASTAASAASTTPNTAAAQVAAAAAAMNNSGHGHGRHSTEYPRNTPYLHNNNNNTGYGMYATTSHPDIHQSQQHYHNHQNRMQQQQQSHHQQQQQQHIYEQHSYGYNNHGYNHHATASAPILQHQQHKPIENTNNHDSTTTVAAATAGTNNAQEEEQQQFPTPQPHYKRINGSGSPSAAASDRYNSSPSPPQPMDNKMRSNTSIKSEYDFFP